MCSTKQIDYCDYDFLDRKLHMAYLGTDRPTPNPSFETKGHVCGRRRKYTSVISCHREHVVQKGRSFVFDKYTVMYRTKTLTWRSLECTKQRPSRKHCFAMCHCQHHATALQRMQWRDPNNIKRTSRNILIVEHAHGGSLSP